MAGRRALTGIGVLLLGGSVALVPITAASASSKHKDKHHAAKKGSATASTKCPTSSVVTTATGVAYKGPEKNVGGTAGCIYDGPNMDELNIVFEGPNESKSAFIAGDPAAIGKPATAVSGLGEAAFSTMTYGHAEVDVYESPTKGFGITLDPGNSAAVTQADVTQVEAVAHALFS